MISKDLLMAGPAAAAQSVAGAVVGYAWWWSVWGATLGSQGVLANAAQAPQWLRDLMGEGRAPRPPPNAGGVAAGLAAVQAIHPRRPATSTSGREGQGQPLGD